MTSNPDTFQEIPTLFFGTGLGLGGSPGSIAKGSCPPYRSVGGLWRHWRKDNVVLDSADLKELSCPGPRDLDHGDTQGIWRL